MKTIAATGRHLRQERSGPPAAERGLRCAAAEGSRQIGALSRLQQHNQDQDDAHHDVQERQQIVNASLPGTYFPPAQRFYSG